MILKKLREAIAGLSLRRSDFGPSELRPAAIRLHIGGKQQKTGWMILNVQAGPGVDCIGDITDLNGFADESFQEIYASHVLEHVSQAKMDETLQGLRRVLKTGGRLMISVPDLDVLCSLFLNRELSVEDRFHVMRMMYGGQVDAHDFHHIGLNLEILLEYLKMAGFSRLERVLSFGIFDDTSDYHFKGTPISLNVMVWK